MTKGGEVITEMTSDSGTNQPHLQEHISTGMHIVLVLSLPKRPALRLDGHLSSLATGKQEVARHKLPTGHWKFSFKISVLLI